MVNTKNWINNFKNLNPDNQLKVAEAIINELKDNEIILDESEYNKDQSKAIRNLFDKLKFSIEQRKESKKFATIIERFDSLSKSNKRKVIDELFKIIKKYYGIQEQETKKKICKEEGHLFGNWKMNSWTTKEVYWDAGSQGTIDVPHTEWYRTCARCGFIEKVKHEPQELIAARKEKQKEEQIKKLEKKLKELKGE